jgi:hypothetical protein
MDKTLISNLFLKLLGYWLSWLSTDIPKKNYKKKLVDIGNPPRKCVHQAFIIQKLDVLILELGMKVQFADYPPISPKKL